MLIVRISLGEVKKNIEKIEECIESTLSHIEGGVLATISGGADSMALLHALHRLKKPFIAAHCNFHLRGGESMRDENFVTGECNRLGVKLVKTDFNVEEYMSRHGVTMEVACRELRYSWFRSLMKEHHLARIATAHHSDDNTETMLLNMLRGSGLDGLKGMVVDNGEIIRPLLNNITRDDIERYLTAIGAEHITDSSNLTTDPDRNFIRLEVLPLLRSRWQRADKALAATRLNMERCAKIYDAYMADILANGAMEITATQILNSADAISVIHEFLKPRGANKDMEREILNALTTPRNEARQWILADKSVLLLHKGRLSIYPPIEGEYPTVAQSGTLHRGEDEAIPHAEDRDTAYLPRPLSRYRMRPWREGERVRPLGMKGQKLISDILKEAGIPLPYRKKFMVLADADTDAVVWIPGCKRTAEQLISYENNEIYVLKSQFKYI